MGILDRFTNPVWHEASKLSTSSQVKVAILINAHGYLREVVQERLVDPIIQVLESGKLNASLIGPCAENGASQFREHLIDEAVLGLLKCCKRPSTDLSNKLTDQIAHSLPDVLGTFALSDSNNRQHRSTPSVLAEVNYSPIPEEACDQVLWSFMKILDVPDPSLRDIISDEGFAERWIEMSELALTGMLIGAGRVDDNITIEKARSNSASLPPHRKPLVLYMISRVSET
jgi:hypothetical protein